MTALPVAVDDEPPPRSSPAAGSSMNWLQSVCANGKSRKVFESDDCNIDNMEDYDPEAGSPTTA